MAQPDIYNIVSQLVGQKSLSQNTTPRLLIKDLLPIDNAYGFYTSNKVEFYDPFQDQIFYRKFDLKNETNRCEAIDYINGRIDYYNKLWKEEFGKNKNPNANKYYIPHLPKWSLNLKLSSPIIYKPNDSNKPSHKKIIRILNNQYVYNLSIKLDNNIFVPAFNKMVYEYIDSLRSGKSLVRENTLYNPIIEYEDWFMSSGIDIDKVKSLLYITTSSFPTKRPVSYEPYIIHNTISAKYSIRANPENSKWNSTPAESKIINLIQNGTLETFINDFKFQNINKINFKKLSIKLKCSDKTAKKIIEKHAPYLIYE